MLVREDYAIEIPDGIRWAESGDIPAMAELGRQALADRLPPYQLISIARLVALAETCVMSTINYAMVGLRDGVVEASVCGIVHDQMCFERKQLTVVQFYTRVPGLGMPLLRHMMAWADAQKRKIKCVEFTGDAGMDPKVGKLLKRLGCEHEELPVFVRWS